MALRYADTVGTGAATLSAGAGFDGPRSATDASGTLSQFLSGGWSAQGSLSGSVFRKIRDGIFGELGAFAGGSAHVGGSKTGEALANVRLHFMREKAEFFTGIGVGRTSFGDGVQNVVVGELGTATRLREVDATLTVSPIAVDSIRYADTQLALSSTQRMVDVDALLGFRVGDQLTGLGSTSRTWGSLSAVTWLRPHLGVVVSGGTYPIDPTQGFPGGRFVSLSVRFARGRGRARGRDGTRADQIPIVERPVAESRDFVTVEEFSWVKSGARDVTLRANAPLAQSLEVNGDFTDWTPVPMTRAGDGWWSLTLRLNPGKYQMNLRINRGSWIVPPGLLSMVDEFGGSVGLLVVE
jgi:hypothetical protein